MGRPASDHGQRRRERDERGRERDERWEPDRRRERDDGPRAARAAGAAGPLRRRARRRSAAGRRLADTGGHARGNRVMTIPYGPHPVTVVIADDQALVRGGFRLILKAAGIDVLAEAADGEQAVAAVLDHQPDVVLMDIRMPGIDGIEATRRIVAAGATCAAGASDAADSAGAGGAGEAAQAGPRIIMLTTFDLDEYVYEALSAGASGFLLKDVTPEHLVAAVQLVRTGDALLAPSITRRLVERFAPRPGGPAGLPGSTQPAASSPSGRAGVAGSDVSALT